MPRLIENSQIVDMLYKYDKERKQTVLVSLHHGGLISSFQIESNFVPKSQTQIQQKDKKPKNNTSYQWSNSTNTEPRQKLEVLQSLLTKIFDEMEHSSQSGDSNLPFFSQGDDNSLEDNLYKVLTNDEITMLNEIYDQVVTYIEIGIYCLLFTIPAVIYFVKRWCARYYR